MKDFFTENDLFTSVRERIANPFIFSFAIAWLFCNWTITIGMLWHSPGELAIFGYENYSQLINENINTRDSLQKPTLIAILYTLFLPLLNWGIDVFNAYIQRFSTDSVLRVTKAGTVPTKRYYDLKNSFNTQVTELTDLINQEAAISTENGQLTAQLARVNAKITTLNNTIKKQTEDMKTLKDRSKTNNLNGRWAVKYNNENFTWEIDAQDIFESIRNIQKLNRYRITNYVCDPITGNAALEYMPLVGDKISGPESIFVGLQWNDDFTTLETAGKYNEFHRQIILSKIIDNNNPKQKS